LVEAGAVVIRGSATDGLSGLLGVSCNGSAATLDDTGFTCQVTVPVGTTTIEVRATDVASNVRTVTVDVTTVDDVSAPVMDGPIPFDLIGDGVGFDWSGVACARDTGAVKFGWVMGLGDRGGLLKPVDFQGPRHG
jgi:hypothetical protein